MATSPRSRLLGRRVVAGALGAILGAVGGWVTGLLRAPRSGGRR